MNSVTQTEEAKQTRPLRKGGHEYYNTGDEPSSVLIH